jgi:putative membrane protein
MVTFFPLEADGGVGEAEAAFRAALVLLVSSPDKARAAATQGTFPLIAIVLLVIGLAM